MGIITGWGSTDKDIEQMSPFLREGKIEIFPRRLCPMATNLQYLYNYKSMICGFAKSGTDTCQVESILHQKCIEFI
jgi:hypothetical protein